MKADYALYALLAVVIAGLAFSVADMLNYNPFNSAKVGQKDGSSGFRTVSTGSTEEGDVQIDLKPMGIVDGRLAFEIAANTHSVSLSKYDLTKIAVLIHNGKEYSPISAPELSGHHASGEMVFGLGEMPKNFNIVIDGIPKVEERVFEWK